MIMVLMIIFYLSYLFFFFLYEILLFFYFIFCSIYDKYCNSGGVSDVNRGNNGNIDNDIVLLKMK